MPRLPVADPATLAPEARASYERMASQAPKVLANATEAFVPWLAAMEGIRRSPDLDPVLRELVLLRAVARAGCEYIRVQHEAHALAAGATADQLAAVAALAPLAGREGVVVGFVDALFQGRRPDDASVAEALDVVSARGLLEAILIYGIYLTNSLYVEVADLPVEPAVGTFPEDRP